MTDSTPATTCPHGNVITSDAQACFACMAGRVVPATAAPEVRVPDESLCWGPFGFGDGHTVSINGICDCGKPRAASDAVLDWWRSPTGRTTWLDHQDCLDAFGPDRAQPENVYAALAPVGMQSGTYFKTSRTHDGMTVWRWGRRDAADC